MRSAAGAPIGVVKMNAPKYIRVTGLAFDWAIEHGIGEWYKCATMRPMSTATLRIDDALRERIARVAAATDQSPHSFMVQALAEKVVEAEWKLALHQEAAQRDAALHAGEPAVEWHEMRDWLQRRLKEQPVRRKARRE